MVSCRSRCHCAALWHHSSADGRERRGPLIAGTTNVNVHPQKLTAAPAHFLGDGTDVRRELGASIGGGAALPSLANEPDASEAARFNGVGTPLGRAALAAEVVLLLPTLRGESVDETGGRGESAGACGERAAEAPPVDETGGRGERAAEAPPVSAPRGDLVGTGILLLMLLLSGGMLPALCRADFGGSLAAPELPTALPTEPPTACASGDGGRLPLSTAVVLLVLSLLPESAVAGGLGESSAGSASSGFVAGGSAETAAASLDLCSVWRLSESAYAAAADEERVSFSSALSGALGGA